MAVTVAELQPGDYVVNGEQEATYVGKIVPHPMYPGLALVLWILDNGEWSHDALLLRQNVGELRMPRFSTELLLEGWEPGKERLAQLTRAWKQTRH